MIDSRFISKCCSGEEHDVGAAVQPKRIQSVHLPAHSFLQLSHDDVGESPLRVYLHLSMIAAAWHSVNIPLCGHR
jgi:hypothetical protein